MKPPLYSYDEVERDISRGREKNLIISNLICKILYAGRSAIRRLVLNLSENTN